MAKDALAAHEKRASDAYDRDRKDRDRRTAVVVATAITLKVM